MNGASLLAQLVKNPPAMQETLVWLLGWEDPQEEGMATHSSILAWRSPMDREVSWAIVRGGRKESDTIEQLSTMQNSHFWWKKNLSSTGKKLSLSSFPTASCDRMQNRYLFTTLYDFVLSENCNCIEGLSSKWVLVGDCPQFLVMQLSLPWQFAFS